MRQKHVLYRQHCQVRLFRVVFRRWHSNLHYNGRQIAHNWKNLWQLSISSFIYFTSIKYKVTNNQVQQQNVFSALFGVHLYTKTFWMVACKIYFFVLVGQEPLWTSAREAVIRFTVEIYFTHKTWNAKILNFSRKIRMLQIGSNLVEILSKVA